MGLNKDRLSLKRHFGIFQLIQQGFYSDVKILKPEKKSTGLFKPIFSLWNLKFYIYVENLTDGYSILGTTAVGLFPYLDEEGMRKDSAKMLYEEFQRVKEQTRPSPRLDLDTAHIFCQWQSCLLMGLYLNQLLSTPLPEPDLTR